MTHSTRLRTILFPLLAPWPKMGSSAIAVSPTAVTSRPEGSRPTGLRTVGANLPTCQPWTSETSPFLSQS